MKTFRNLASKWWYILLCTLIVACSDSSDVTEIEPIPEPEPEEQNYRLKDGVVEIKGDNLDYIVDAIDGSTLILSDDYPSEELPTVGEIVFVYPNSKKLNHGFLGKVTQIEKSDGNYHFITEAVALDEAFSYLKVDETIDFELDMADEESRVSLGDDDGYKTASQELNFTLQLPHYTQLKVGGKTTIGLRIRSVIDINDAENVKYQRVEFSKLCETDISAHFALTNDNVAEEIDKKELFNFKIPLGSVSFFASTDVVVSFVSNIEAALNFSLGYQFKSSYTVIVENIDNQWLVDSYKGANTEEPLMMLLPDAQIAFEGSLFLGFAMSPEVKLFGRDEMKIVINPAVGGKCSAEINYNPETDKSLYEALEDDKLTISPLSVAISAEATASIWKWQGRWSTNVLEFDLFPLVNKYIFPSFDDDFLKYSEGELVASTELGRDLLWKQDVGLALYKGDECIVRSDSVEYKFEEEFKEENPLEATFEDISENDINEYSVWSFVKWGDNYIKCKQLIPERKLLHLVWDTTNDMYLEKNNYSFIYDDESGLITRIVNNNSLISCQDSGTSEVSDKIVYDFEYDGNKESVKVNVTSDIDGHKYTFDISLNEDGYIKSCKQTYYDGDVGNWTFKYNDNGQMTYMKRTEYNEDWNLVYDDAGNAITVESNGDDGTNTIFYGAVENVSNVVFETMTGLDIYYMEVFGFVGMLGKPSSNYVVKRNNNPKYSGNYDYTFSWNVDEMGFPIKVNIAEPDVTSNLNFVWEE